MSPTANMSIVIVGIVFLGFVPPVGVLLILLGLASGGLSTSLMFGKENRKRQAARRRQALADERQMYIDLRRF